MNNPNAPKLSQQEYFNNFRNRFEEEFGNKTDGEIAWALQANDNRENYEKEFAYQEDSSNPEVNEKFHKDYSEALMRFPASGVESNPRHSYKSTTENGVENIITYLPTSNIFEITTIYPQQESGPATRSMTIDWNKGNMIIRGTDFCAEDEGDHPGMREKQIDQITTSNIHYIKELIQDSTSGLLDK